MHGRIEDGWTDIAAGRPGEMAAGTVDGVGVRPPVSLAAQRED